MDASAWASSPEYVASATHLGKINSNAKNYQGWPKSSTEQSWNWGAKIGLRSASYESS